MADPTASVAIALLSGTHESGSQLREALGGIGAPVVYEASTHGFDRAALDRSQANVVVVNLDAANDADLDELYALLDDPRYRVVFNDAEVSGGLSGWDQARWMRHLAAKILGDADVDPPRPADAEAVPAPVAAPREAQAERPAIVADVVPTQAIAPAPVATIEPVPPPVPAIDTDPFDLDAMIQVPDVVAPSTLDSDALHALSRSEVAHEHEFDASLLAAFDDLDAPPAAPDTEVPKPALDAGAFAFDDLDASALDFDIAPPQKVQAFDVSADSLPEFDFDLDLLGEDLAPATTAAKTETVTAPAIVSPTEWSLEDVLDGETPVATPAAHAAADFGIEKMRAEEFLAPAAEVATPVPEMPNLGLELELIPIEEAVLPGAIESAHVARDNWLDPDSMPVKVRRIWVLGASIGGPEAVREFLAQIPRSYPGLFLLAQHLGTEFVDMMTRQLVQATPLTVRTPTHGERVGHGEVVVVPTSQRLRVDAQGIVVLEKINDEGAYHPSIDRVLRDVADRFGSAAGAIVFSGMGDDAVEGCRYLAEKGGTVYTQRADTCVVSTMVDAVTEIGVVKFAGSPKELAEKLLASPA